MLGLMSSILKNYENSIQQHLKTFIIMYFDFEQREISEHRTSKYHRFMLESYFIKILFNIISMCGFYFN